MSNRPNETYGWNPEMDTPLLEKLKADLKQSMLQKNVAARSAIRQIMAEFPKLTVPITLESGKESTRLKSGEEITDDDIIGIILGLAKSERLVLEAKDEDSSEYLAILKQYLPRMADREEVIAWIKENIDFSEYKNKMQAMGTIMKHFGKQADGKMVNEILKQWE
ncbi:MAG: GatB/YqeY domain-containing protein [Desulfobacterales bacterium]|nr:GatB/YqeY domain-containing protein [Desulfobacterales bacterium]